MNEVKTNNSNEEIMIQCIDFSIRCQMILTSEDKIINFAEKLYKIIKDKE